MDEHLGVLDKLLEEFYSPICKNERKQQIEEILSAFILQPNCHNMALYFLTKTQHDFTRMYSCYVLQKVIFFQWHSLPETQQREVRNALIGYLYENYLHLSNFVATKVCKLIADIARIEWPKIHPEYFAGVYQLINQTSHSCVGLLLLLITLEEFTSSSDEINVARKRELKTLLSDCIPNMMLLLTGCLESVIQRLFLPSSQSTPPPSPSNESLDFFSSSLHSSTDVYVRGQRSLGCLSQIFGSLPLAQEMLPRLISAIFQLANLGMLPMQNKASLGVNAMECLNEFIGKNFIPRAYDEVMGVICHHMLSFLQQMSSDNVDISKIDSNFLSKIVDFLHTFTTNHLKKFESSDFPVALFIEQLIAFTFQQRSPDLYLSCLEVSNSFLDYLIMKKESKISNYSIIIQTYRDCLLKLAGRIMNKIQYSTNQVFLDELDDENLSDDHETEWGRFQRENLEILERMSEILFEDVAALVFPIFRDNIAILQKLISHLIFDEADGTVVLPTKAENDFIKLHCRMKDLSTMSRLMGILNHQFTGSEISNRFQLGKEVFDSLLYIAQYSMKMRLYELKCDVSDALTPDFIQLLIQSLNTLQLYSYWLSQIYAEFYKQSEESLNIVRNYLQIIIEVCCTLLANQSRSIKVSESLSRSAVNLLCSLASTVRAPFFMDLCTSFVQLVVSESFNNLHNAVQLKCIQTITVLILCPWSFTMANEQKWEEREVSFTGFLSKILLPLEQLPECSETTSFTPHQTKLLANSILYLTTIVQCLVTEVKKARQICCTAIKSYLPKIMQLAKVEFHNRELCEPILDLLEAILDTLKSQLGPQISGEIIQNMMALVSTDNVKRIFDHHDQFVSCVLVKFVKMLMRIVEEPACSFKVFLPTVISLVTENIFPLADRTQDVDVLTQLIDLMFQIVNLNWRYFSESKNNENFKLIMTIFATCLQISDVHIFKHTLNALQRLNEIHCIYHKNVFEGEMIYTFQLLLLNALAGKSQNLNKDEIIQTLHSMTLVNTSYFFTKTISSFLDGKDLTDNQKHLLKDSFTSDEDLPTYFSNIEQLIGDLNYFRLKNTSFYKREGLFTT